MPPSASLGGEYRIYPELIRPGHTLCYDMMYASGATPFKPLAAEQCASARMDGLGNAVEQAAGSLVCLCVACGLTPTPVLRRARIAQAMAAGAEPRRFVNSINGRSRGPQRRNGLRPFRAEAASHKQVPFRRLTDCVPAHRFATRAIQDSAHP